MIKKEFEVAKKTIQIRCCDICEAEIIRGDYTPQWPSQRCCMCRKDLCEWHRCLDPVDEDRLGEEPPEKVYCPECFEVVEKYLYELRKLEEEYDNDTQFIRVKMKSECDKLKEKND